VIAGRLAQDTNAKILLVEAGPHNKDLENVHMVGGWSKNFDSETDWNLVTPEIKGIDNRKVKLSRGKFLGGSSGVNVSSLKHWFSFSLSSSTHLLYLCYVQISCRPGVFRNRHS